MGVVWLSNASSDMVLVGYAFRGHWYWHNGYGTRQISILVWKDYNCVQSSLLSFNSSSNNFRGLERAMTDAYNADNSLSGDIWRWGFTSMESYFIQHMANSFTEGDRSKLGITGIFVNGPIDKMQVARNGIQVLNNHTD